MSTLPDFSFTQFNSWIYCLLLLFVYFLFCLSNKNYSCFLAAFIVLSSCGLLFNRSCFFTAPTVLYSWDILFNRFFSEEYICDRFLCISCLFFHIPSFVFTLFFFLWRLILMFLCASYFCLCLWFFISFFFSFLSQILHVLEKIVLSKGWFPYDRKRSQIADNRKETCFHIIADDRKRPQSRL